MPGGPPRTCSVGTPRGGSQDKGMVLRIREGVPPGERARKHTHVYSPQVGLHTLTHTFSVDPRPSFPLAAQAGQGEGPGGQGTSPGGMLNPQTSNPFPSPRDGPILVHLEAGCHRLCHCFPFSLSLFPSVPKCLSSLWVQLSLYMLLITSCFAAFFL